MRATDLPFNQRITLLKSLNESTELKMQNLRGDLKKVTKAVKSEFASDSNLTSEQQRGVKSLIRRVKEKDIVVFQTNKSGHFSVDIPENNLELVRPHLEIDAEVDRGKQKEVEEVLNTHGISWTRILAASQCIGHEDRINDDDMRTHNCAPQPLYGLNKDHKVHDDEMDVHHHVQYVPQ